MHAETDYIGEELGVRDYDAVYIVKPCTRRIPAGVAVIDQNDLLEVIWYIFNIYLIKHYV